MKSKFLFISLMLLVPSLHAGNWPQWRGPDSNGISREKNIPVQWSSKENVAWKVELSGRGNSTPVIWEDQIFITTQKGEGPQDLLMKGGGVDPGDPDVDFFVESLDRNSGNPIWSFPVKPKGNLHPVHGKHNLASPSCATDGEVVVAWFATGQAVVLDLQGKELWSRNIAAEYGEFLLLWGHSSSPFIYNDKIFLICGHKKGAYLLAVDKMTGKTVWRTERGKGKRVYSTPLVIETGEGPQLIINANDQMDACDPNTGKSLWSTDSFCKVPIAMPVYHNGIIYTSRGYRSGPYMAFPVDGTENGKVIEPIWRVKTGAPYISSLIYYNDLIFMATERGVASCLDPKTGETIWKERIGGYFTASPIAADNHIYFMDEDGLTVVIEASENFKIVAENQIDEVIRASPAVADGQLFIRTDKHLYCIGK